jgi:hypothetical protein
MLQSAASSIVGKDKPCAACRWQVDKAVDQLVGVNGHITNVLQLSKNTLIIFASDSQSKALSFCVPADMDNNDKER